MTRPQAHPHIDSRTKNELPRIEQVFLAPGKDVELARQVRPRRGVDLALPDAYDIARYRRPDVLHHCVLTLRSELLKFNGEFA